MNSNEALIILGKYPYGPDVMTRLAEDTDEETANSVYLDCAQNTLIAANSLPSNPQVLFRYSTRKQALLIASWLEGIATPMVPSSTNLRINWRGAILEAFFQGAEKVVTFLSDVPDLTAKIMEDSLKSLDGEKGCDVVIGPDKSGGIYSIGLRDSKLVKPLFDYKENSAGVSAYISLLEKVRGIGLSWVVLPALFDIDTKENLEQWKKSK